LDGYHPEGVVTEKPQEKKEEIKEAPSVKTSQAKDRVIASPLAKKIASQ